MRKILITSDLHFERIEESLIPKIKEHIKATIEKYRPNIFCIAGDTVDDANLRAETSEFAQLVSFIDDIAVVAEILKSMADIINEFKKWEENKLAAPFLNFIVYTSEEKVYSKTRYLRP